MSKENLEPLEPEKAKKMYHREREGEVSEQTLQEHHYRLKQFIKWCDLEGIENMNELTGRKLHDFRLWRKEDGDLKAVTLRTQLETLRVFIRFCETIDAVLEELSEKILLPTLSKDEERCNALMEPEHAENVLLYLRKYEYASKAHVILELLWHTGIRLGALHSLDLDDYDSDKERLYIHHRPDSQTTLKNGKEGERLIALNPDVCQVLDDWIAEKRPCVKDESGRKPLVTTENGRLSQSYLREIIYQITRPCYYTNDCPEDRDQAECEATTNGHYSRCPMNVSPHAIRRGSITHFLSNDVPEKVVSDRMNVGQDVLDKHYDKRTEEVKAEQRRSYLDNI